MSKPTLLTHKTHSKYAKWQCYNCGFEGLISKAQYRGQELIVCPQCDAQTHADFTKPKKEKDNAL